MNRITIGCAIVAAPNEKLTECLNNLIDQVDDAVIFTWDSDQELLAKSLNIRVERIESISHVELVRQKMQTALLTDWVLILDPDEIVRENGIEMLREQIDRAEPDVVGLWVPCRTMFLGSDLKHSFSGLWQMRLFKRNSVYYTGSIHQTPVPIYGRFEFPDIDEYIITHQFVVNLKERFERHLQWAQVEAQELNKSNFHIQSHLEILDEAINEVWYYLVDKDGLLDGTAGLINALMHGWKKIAVLSMLWELQGSENKTIPEYEKIKTAIENLHKKKISSLFMEQ